MTTATNSSFTAIRKPGLSAESRSQIQKRLPEFSKLQPWKSVFATAFDIVVIAAAILCAKHWDFWPVYLLAMVTIASRQHALLVLMHDASHFRLNKRQWLNDLFGELLAFPHLVTMSLFRQNHLNHHRYNSTDKDPDWKRKMHLQEWHFPKTGGQIGRIFLKYAYGYGLFEIGEAVTTLSKRGKQNRKLQTVRMVGYILVLGLLATTHHLRDFALFWLAPLLILLPVILRVRSLAEHFGVERTHALNDARNIVCGRLERFLFAPHGVQMHLVHHIYPSVPHYNLARFQKFLAEFPDYRENAHENTSYILPSSRSMFSDLLTVKTQA